MQSFWTYTLGPLKAHISPKSSVTSNINLHNFWHHFLAYFFMPFGLFYGMIDLVWSVSSENHIDYRKWFLLTLRAKPITPCERAWNTEPENGVRKLFTFLFEANYALGKMWAPTPITLKHTVKLCASGFDSVLGPPCQNLSLPDSVPISLYVYDIRS